MFPPPLRAVLAGVLLLACDSVEPVPRPAAPAHDGIHSFAQGCYAMDATDPGSDDTRWLEATSDGEGFRFAARSLEAGALFFLKPSDLGTYLFYDEEGHYLVGEEGRLARRAELESDLTLVEDAFVSPAEWQLEISAHDPDRLQLRNLASGEYLARGGLTSEEGRAAVVALYPAEGCAEHPELTVDADGEVGRTRFDDGDLFGIVETHTHILTNFGFGGGGIFHGAPFHRLGVEHALGSCERFHDAEGRADVFGYGFDQGRDAERDALLESVIAGETPEFNHYTDGYPEFTDWPSAPFSSTHQTQYYRWLERAHLGGLRLLVQHATSNQVICDFMVGNRVQDVRYSCNDMVTIDRQIEEAYAMERYIDAQEGGPGEGWFRIVTSPEMAREVIAEGKLAVVLGIEVSNLFDCFSTPREGYPICDEDYVVEQLDYYEGLGVRALFPVHKYDNAFTAGDGDRFFGELGNFINSSHWSSFTLECPTDHDAVFDKGDVRFGGLNMPREEYFAPPPNDLTAFPDEPILTMAPYIDKLTAPSLEGSYCQTHGLTSLGEFLLAELMRRGMIIEIDHFNQRAYQRAFEILEAADYPAAGTHGTDNGGRIYAIGGISKGGLGRCHDPDEPATTIRGLERSVQLIRDNGGYPAQGFGFDLNGFAGGPGPRFGERSRCGSPQDDPVTYPFQSYAGDVTFTEPRLGNRAVDFNTEGMAHIGLMPELIEDVRRDGVTDEQLEPLFRSAEGYIRMWERARERSAALP